MMMKPTYRSHCRANLQSSVPWSAARAENQELSESEEEKDRDDGDEPPVEDSSSAVNSCNNTL